MAQENLNIRIRAFDKTRAAFRTVNAGLGAIRKTVFNTKTAITGLAGAAGLGCWLNQRLKQTGSFNHSKPRSKLFQARLRGRRVLLMYLSSLQHRRRSVFKR